MRGSKRERRPGVWELRAHLGGGRQVSRTFHGSEKAADSALAKLVVSVDTKTVSADRGRVNDLLDEYIADRTPLLSPATMSLYTVAAALVHSTPLGSQRLSRVTPRLVAAAYQELRERGVTEYRLRHIHGLLRAAFHQGMDWGVVTGTPMARVRAPRLPRKKVEIPDPSDIRRLLEHLEARDPDLADILFLACTTGLRRGALVGLQWGDLKGSRLTLRRSLVRIGKEIHVRPPKMRQPGEVEYLDLGPLEVGVFDRVRARQRERSLSAGLLRHGEWVLSRDGIGETPRSPDSLNNGMYQACSELGIEKISPHDLRHFMATMALAGGVAITDLAARLHHSSPSITMSTYAHATRRGPEIGGVIAAALSASELQNP